MALLRRDFLPEELGREMTRTAVDACVVVQARQSIDETRWLLALADAHAHIAGVVGWFDLQISDVAGGPRSLGAAPEAGWRSPHRAERGRRSVSDAAGISVAASPSSRAFGLAYDLLIYPRHLPCAVEFVSRFERQRFVLDHLAKPDIRAAASERRGRGIFAAWPPVRR